jgi:galactokinase
VEVLFGTIFNYLYADEKFSPLDIAIFGQKAENLYFGKPCGLMDQAASASGGAVVIDFADGEKAKVEKMPFNPENAGFSLCVVNTKGSHADLTPDYAAIPAEMKSVAAFFGKNFLNELCLEDVVKNATAIRQKCGDRAFLRALHFFQEDKRVIDAAGLVDELSDDSEDDELMYEFLEVIEKSGKSSFEFLQNAYSPGKSIEQGIPVAIALSEHFFDANEVFGVCRVHGGGFAGTVQTYVPHGLLEEYCTLLESVFGAGSVTVLRIRQTGCAEIVF